MVVILAHAQINDTGLPVFGSTGQVAQPFHFVASCSLQHWPTYMNAV